jgi:hypothetical protein
MNNLEPPLAVVFVISGVAIGIGDFNHIRMSGFVIHKPGSSPQQTITHRIINLRHIAVLVITKPGYIPLEISGIEKKPLRIINAVGMPALGVDNLVKIPPVVII